MRPPLRIKKVHWRTKAKLERMYRQTRCPRLRQRVQMVLLSVEGQPVPEIAAICRTSEDTVRYWLHRFLAYGWVGLVEGHHTGRPAQVTPDIEAFLLTCLEQSPREYGVSRPTWTTAALARVTAQHFSVMVTDECIRQHLGHLDIVCRRPTWSVKHLARQQAGYAQNGGCRGC